MKEPLHRLRQLKILFLTNPKCRYVLKIKRVDYQQIWKVGEPEIPNPDPL